MIRKYCDMCERQEDSMVGTLRPVYIFVSAYQTHHFDHVCPSCRRRLYKDIQDLLNVVKEAARETA